MNITAVDVIVIVVCLLFVGVVFVSKSKAHAGDSHIRPRRDRHKRRD